MNHTSERMLSLMNTANIFLVSCLLNCAWHLLHPFLLGCHIGCLTPFCAAWQNGSLFSNSLIFSHNFIIFAFSCDISQHVGVHVAYVGSLLCLTTCIALNSDCFVWQHVIQHLPLFQFAVSCTQHVQIVLVKVRFLFTLFRTQSGSVSFRLQMHVTSNKHM